MPLLDDIDFPNPLTSPFTDDNGYTWDWSGTTWNRRTQGMVEEAPIDTVPYVRKDAAWVAGMINDPGAASTIYARQNGAWVEVVDAGTGLTDAPVDGTGYLRKNAGWVTPTIADMPVVQAELDGKAALSHNHTLSDVIDSGAMAAEGDAPDASSYARKLGAWVAITPAAGITFSESVTILSPQDTDDATLFYSEAAITVSQIHAHLQGTTNAVINIRFAALRNAVGTKVFTVDQTITSLPGVHLNPNTAAIPAGSWVWLDIVSVTDTPDMLHVTVSFGQD